MGFQAVFGLSIHLAMSEMVRLGSSDDVEGLARILGCRLVSLPIKYLGLSLGTKSEEVRV